MNCQRSMNCRRCGSTMTFKKFFDYGGHSWGWECISCKEIIDQIQENRQQLKGAGIKSKKVRRYSVLTCMKASERKQGDKTEPHLVHTGNHSLRIMGRNTAMNKDFNPRRYGMVVCPLCDGKGFLIMDTEKMSLSVRTVCVKCGGFGAIKKEEKVFKSPGN